MELQAAKYASSLHKLLTKFKGVKKQGKELAESICSRKAENKTDDFDKKLNQKCANLLEFAESANSIGLTLIENSKKVIVSILFSFLIIFLVEKPSKSVFFDVRIRRFNFKIILC